MDWKSEDSSHSTKFTPGTNSKSAKGFSYPANTMESTEPKPRSTYIIRSVTTGHVIKLSDGHVTLSARDTYGSDEWVCVKGVDGWIGFRNRIAGRLLGYDKNWNLCCSAEDLRQWEWFRARKRAEGGFVLIMSHWWRGLQPVGIREAGGKKKLAMIKSWEADEAVWEFIEV